MRYRTVIGIALTVGVLFVTLLVLASRWQEFTGLRPTEYGGTLSGLAGTIALIWLVVGYSQQGEDLTANTAALKQQEEELRAQAKHLTEIVRIAALQAEAIQKSLEVARQQIESQQAADSAAHSESTTTKGNSHR
jgi:hypothetical protein